MDDLRSSDMRLPIDLTGTARLPRTPCEFNPCLPEEGILGSRIACNSEVEMGAPSAISTADLETEVARAMCRSIWEYNQMRSGSRQS